MILLPLLQQEEPGLPVGLIWWVLIFFGLPALGRLLNWVITKFSGDKGGTKKSTPAPPGTPRPGTPPSDPPAPEPLARKGEGNAFVGATSNLSQESRSPSGAAAADTAFESSTTVSSVFQDGPLTKTPPRPSAKAVPQTTEAVPERPHGLVHTTVGPALAGSGALPSETPKPRPVERASDHAPLSSALPSAEKGQGQWSNLERSRHLETLRTRVTTRTPESEAIGALPRNRSQWRRAIVWSELLSQPVALREKGHPNSPAGLD